MATYTMYLKDVIESLFNDSLDPDDFEQTYESLTYANVTYGKLPTVPDDTALGMGTYPVFAEDYRKILNGKIIDEYYMREIGVETIDIFTANMRKRLDQIMPYYNQLYKSLDFEYNPLQTMDIHSVSESTLEGSEEASASNETTNNTDSKSRAVNSETPQTMLAGDADYATGASDVNSESLVNSEASQESNSTNNTATNSDNRVTGFQGVASDLINRYRQSLINIDVMIIRDLEDLFMLILNSGDEYSTTNSYFYG